ncbi:MAG: Rha family transcriptional regulator [Rhodocyclaceae bacterium]|nr:Rha family transcriptional regulator [Rhodocyclaceae bacterium]
MTAQIIPFKPEVTVKDGHVLTTSLAVAEAFGKQHKNVLQAIEKLDCSEEFRRLNFQPSSYINEQGKSQPMIEMARDGFVFLCMGFTGAKAAAMKEAYIARFNEMEAALFGRRNLAAALPDALTPEEFNRQIERLMKTPLVIMAADYHRMCLAADYHRMCLAANAHGKPRPFTEEEKAEMQVRVARGDSVREIARALGRHESSVRGRLHPRIRVA